MKKSLLFLIIQFYIVSLSAQDTIYVKTGEKIPAIILSKDQTEIRYKKSGQPEPAAIYSIFVSDVSSIHYSDGIVADYTNIAVRKERPKSALALAGNYGINKISIGGGAGYSMRYGSDNLDEFWATRPGNTKLNAGSPCYYIDIKFSALTSQSQRHWACSGLLLYNSPGAVHVIGNNDLDEINIGISTMTIYLGYGYAFNTKKNLILAFEPGFDFVSTSGFFRVNNVQTDIFSELLQTGWHFSTGIDWLFSKILHANFRIGQRFSRSVTEKHFDENSPTWYSHYYVNGDPVSIQTNGLYVTVGLSASMYFKYGYSRSQ